MKLINFKFSILFVLCIWINLSYATVSDEVCSVFGNFSAPSDAISENANKTLNIIFDTTGSMWDDLDNLQAAAVEIVNKFSTYPTNPIGHYVLSQFNDPTTDLFQTTDSSLFLSALQSVPIGGGGDCPELAMSGIINALSVSQPNSFAYVFTDADALDYYRANEVLNLVQQKQIIVNFLTTSNCFGEDSVQFKVFETIAKFSGGIVFDMFRSEVKDVMTSLSVQLEPNYVSISSYEYSTDIISTTKLKIDASFGLIVITINGVNPSIEVQKGNDPNNFVNFTIEYESSSFKMISFDANDTFYEIITTASSDYSLRIGGESGVTLKYGFSQKVPESFNETTAEPAWDQGNFLSVFVSDKGFIKCIYKVAITPIYPETSFEAFDVDIVTRNGTIYTSENFTLPEGAFKISASGFDSLGNEFERTLSTGLRKPGE